MKESSKSKLKEIMENAEVIMNSASFDDYCTIEYASEIYDLVKEILKDEGLA